MPIFLAALGGVLLNITGSIVGRVLLALGIGVVTYTGIDTSLTWLKTQALSSAATLPSELLGLMAFLKIGECISIVTSAVIMRQVLDGVQSGTFKRWVTK